MGRSTPTPEQIAEWEANPQKMGEPGFEDYSMWKFEKEWAMCPSPEEHIQLANNDWILAGELKVGDEVATSETPQKVTRVQRIEGVPRCEVFFEEGNSIVSSYTHPYFVEGKGFVEVMNLEKGDVIGDLVVDNKKSFSDGPVISLSVDKTETYMLRGGTEEKPVPVLSHNKSPMPYEPDTPPGSPDTPVTSPDTPPEDTTTPVQGMTMEEMRAMIEEMQAKEAARLAQEAEMSKQYLIPAGPQGYNPYLSGQYQGDPYGAQGVPSMGGITTIPVPEDYLGV